jgi:hypothetical protein
MSQFVIVQSRYYYCPEHNTEHRELEDYGAFIGCYERSPYPLHTLIEDVEEVA